MAEIVINGFSKRGMSVQILNNRVIVDGVDVTPEGKAITIEVKGNIENMSVDVCQVLNIHGDVGSLANASGDVLVGRNVLQSISSTSGDITCSNVGGSVEATSGSITIVGNVSGSVSTTTGNISYR